MNHDDPEKRIAELEHQLAERKRIAGVNEFRARPAEPSTNLGAQGFSPMRPFPGQVNPWQQAGFAPPPVDWQHPLRTPQLGSWRTPPAGSGAGRGGRSIAAWLIGGLFALNFLVGGLIGYVLA